MSRDRSTTRADAFVRAAQPVDTTAVQFPTYPQAQQQQEKSRFSTLRSGPRKPAIPIVAGGKNS